MAQVVITDPAVICQGGARFSVSALKATIKNLTPAERQALMQLLSDLVKEFR